MPRALSVAFLRVSVLLLSANVGRCIYVWDSLSPSSLTAGSNAGTSVAVSRDGAWAVVRARQEQAEGSSISKLGRGLGQCRPRICAQHWKRKRCARKQHRGVIRYSRVRSCWCCGDAVQQDKRSAGAAVIFQCTGMDSCVQVADLVASSSDSVARSCCSFLCGHIGHCFSGDPWCARTVGYAQRWRCVRLFLCIIHRRTHVPHKKHCC